MLFARQFYRLREAPDLQRFVNTEFAKKDPCLNCTLWKCDEKNGECRYGQITGRKVVTSVEKNDERFTDEQTKADIIAILEKMAAARKQGKVV